MIARAAALALLTALAAPAAAGPADRSDGPAKADPGSPDPGGAGQAPLVVTMPDTQPALPSGRIEMDPSQVPSTGDANKLEPNIDGTRLR